MLCVLKTVTNANNLTDTSWNITNNGKNSFNFFLLLLELNTITQIAGNKKYVHYDTVYAERLQHMMMMDQLRRQVRK